MAEIPACSGNIGPRQQRLRIAIGALATLVAIGLAFGLLVSGQAWPWRLLVAVPVGLAALNGFQVKARTCVFLAAVGRQHLDSGAGDVVGAAEARQLRRRAYGIYLKTFVVTAAITALLVLLPL